MSGPGNDRFCVLAMGAGYIVTPDSPASWQQVRCEPIVHAFRVPFKEVLVFAGFTQMVAYGPQGLLWVSENLSWDGLNVTEVTQDVIKGTGWDSPADAWVPFVIWVDDGRSEGGAASDRF